MLVLLNGSALAVNWAADHIPAIVEAWYPGRTYRYFRGEPLFPFGYGLSYTTFEFDNLDIDRAEVRVGGQVAVSVDVTNAGDRAGDEVVQLYVRRRDATVPRPIKELKGSNGSPYSQGNVGR